MAEWSACADEIDRSSPHARSAILLDRSDDRAARRRFWLLTATVLLLGSALRVGALGLHSFWFDEVVAMRVALVPSLGAFADRLARMDMVGAPLHPLLLKGWIAAWGTSEAAARGLSAVFSILGLCAFTATAWQAFRSRGATLTAAALLAVCPLDLLYAMENRMYSLMAFLTIASWGLLFSFRRSRSVRRELAYGLGLVALAYTHPLGGLMILALGLGYLIDERRSTLRPARWLALQVLVLAAILPWVGRYFDHPPDSKINPGLLNVIFDWAAYGLAWPVRLMPVLLGVVALAWLVPARRLRLEAARGADDGLNGAARLRTGLMLCAWVALPMGLMVTYSRLRHPILGPIRYQVFLMPGLLLLIAGAARFRPMTVGGLVAVLALAYTLPALPTQVYNKQTKPAWREATRAMLRRSPRPTVVLSAREPHMYYHTVDYYLPDDAPVISLLTYLERHAAGTLDRTRDYWLFHDDKAVRNQVLLPSRLLPLRPGPVLDFGRLTASKLDPTMITHVDALIR